MNEFIKTADDINQFNPFFDKIKSLLDLKTEITEEQKLILYYWLKEANKHLNEHVFVRVALIRLLSVLKRLVHNQSICTYLYELWEKHPEFVDKLILVSHNSLQHQSAKHLTLILNNLVCFTERMLEMPLEWMQEWNECALGKIKEFTSQGFYQSLHAYAKMQIVPDSMFILMWFKYACKTEWTASPHEFFQLIWLLKTLKIDIDEGWLARWSKLAASQLLKLCGAEGSIGDLLHSSDLLQLHSVEQNKHFMTVWFDIMTGAMASLDDNQLKHIFREVMKTGCRVPLPWIEAFAARMSKRFKRLSCREITTMLYAFACCGVDVKHVLSFLKKSKTYFNTVGENAFNLKQVSHFRKALIAQHYFKTKGFDLGIQTELFNALTQTLHDEEHHILDHKKQVCAYICHTHAEAFKPEVWVDSIVNRVDLMDESTKKIVEIYGVQHFDGKELKQSVKLKNYLLEQEGYKLLLLDSREFDDNWQASVDKQTSIFFENYTIV